jgi:hypothetical protein
MQKWIILILFISFSSCITKEQLKAAFIAGFYESSIFHYKFEMYPDSTFCLNNGLSKDIGEWVYENDTFFLYLEDSSKLNLVAKINNLKVENFKHKFRILKNMKLKSFSPSKIINLNKI